MRTHRLKACRVSSQHRVSDTLVACRKGRWIWAASASRITLLRACTLPNQGDRCA